MLYSHIQLHNTYANISGNIVIIIYELQWTNDTRLYKNIPHTLYSRKGYERVDVGCVWEVSWRREQTATYWPKVLLTIAALLSRSAGLLNRGSLRAQALCLELVLTPRASYLQLQLKLNSNWLKPSVAPGYIIVWHPTASFGRTHLHRIQPRPQVKVIFRIFDWMDLFPLFFCLFTLVHLLIDDSVEGQYVTINPN